jgi:CMP-N,N'-diacetyllegionaminic acid synthase
LELLITLCARGGSKGVPGKNIKPLNGIPLLAYSIKSAREFSEHFPATIALSTDDTQISLVAAAHGLTTTYRRPASLANDTAGKVEVIADLLQYEEKQASKRYDYILDLDISAPLRTVDDLLQAFGIFQKNQEALNLFSVSPPHKNPYFNMVELGEDGYYKLVKAKEKKIMTRQSAPRVYDINASFYFYRRSFFEMGLTSVLTERAMVYEQPHISFDIDEPLDFDTMEYLVTNNKLGFTL